MNGTRFFRTRLLWISLLCFLLTGGCAAEFKKIKSWEYFPWNQKSEASGRKEKAQEKTFDKADDRQEFLVHRIRWKGETLSIIAKWYMGRIDAWEYLADLNPNLSPQNLQVGEKVKIPAEKVKISVPMPKDFLESFIGKTERPEKKKAAQAENDVKKKTKPPGEKEDKASEDTAGEEKEAYETQEKEPDLFGPKELNAE